MDVTVHEYDCCCNVGVTVNAAAQVATTKAAPAAVPVQQLSCREKGRGGRGGMGRVGCQVTGAVQGRCSMQCAEYSNALCFSN